MTDPFVVRTYHDLLHRITSGQVSAYRAWRAKVDEEARVWYAANGEPDPDHVGGVVPEGPIMLFSEGPDGPWVWAYYSLHSEDWTPSTFTRERLFAPAGPMNPEPYRFGICVRDEDVKEIRAWISETVERATARCFEPTIWFGGRRSSMGSDVFVRAVGPDGEEFRALLISEFDGETKVDRDHDFVRTLHWWKKP